MGFEAAPRRDLLIGIGNPLRGDDGAGALLLEELATELGAWRTASAELKAVHQLTPELALAVADARRVLFLDACVSAATAEPWIERLDPRMVQLGVSGGDGAGMGGLGTHHFPPVAVLAVAHCLYGWQGEGALLRVPAFAFPQGTTLSDSLQQALPRARQLVRHWLEGEMIGGLLGSGRG